MAQWRSARTAATLLSQQRKTTRKDLRATYFGKVFLEETYENLVSKLGWGQKDISQFLEPLIDTCFDKSEEVLADEFSTAADGLKKQLHSALLSAVQEIKSLNNVDSDDGQELIFFEPLKHLDDATKHLVLELVIDKVTQIMDGKLSLEALRLSMAKPANEEGRPNMRASIVARSKNMDNMKLQSKAATASDRAEEAIERAEHAERRLKEKTEQMQGEISALQQELEDLRDVRFQLKLTEERFVKADTRRQEMEVRVQDAQTHAEELATRCKDAEARCQDAQVRWQEAEMHREASDASCKGLGQDAETQCEASEVTNTAEKIHISIQTDAEDSLKETINQKTHTSHDSMLQQREHIPQEHIQEQIEQLTLDNNHMRITLQELQAKLKDLMDKSKRSQVKDGSLSEVMTSLIADVGLEPFLKDGRVFHRLYRDAVDRVSRMRELQDKSRELQTDSHSHEYPRHCAISDHRFIIPQKGSMVNKGFIMRRGRQGHLLGRQYHNFELEQL